ncbi:MAG TPA: SpoIIE family protein phosphatase [Ignavibacteria bacterium]
MVTFVDIYEESLNKSGEELCGDKVKIFRNEEKASIVLSDGLGSGVKANILATLTTEIISSMLKADVPLRDVIDTVLKTLPICKIRKIAYATFTIIEIDLKTNKFKVINFDNPPIFFVKDGRIQFLKYDVIEILNKKITVTEGQLDRGDFLAAVSDGVLYAGMGITLNFGWGWDEIANYLEGILITHSVSARNIVSEIINKTYSLYKGNIGDDATVVGVYLRKRNGLILFSGPPTDANKDNFFVKKVLDFDGKRVICGGTTANIVATYLGEVVETLIPTMTKDVPPIGRLSEIDLITEGIITISKCIEYLKESDGEITRLPFKIDGAVMLAKELLRADYIYFLVGLSINSYYQNPLLPKNISIRKNLILELAEILKEKHKEIKIEYC